MSLVVIDPMNRTVVVSVSCVNEAFAILEVEPRKFILGFKKHIGFAVFTDQRTLQVKTPYYLYEN